MYRSLPTSPAKKSLRELQAKNEQIVALQAELSKERQHSREQAERIAVLADQAQRLQLAQM